MPEFNDVFTRLDDWRLLPGYQLERRADIFFSFYLPQVLGAKVCKVKPVLVPEFPVRVVDSNRSFKIDYVAVSADGHEMLLIELKTDSHSIRKEQIEYIITAAQSEPSALLDGLGQISKASTFKEKYIRLWAELDKLGLSLSGTRPLPIKCRIVLVQPTAELKPWVMEMIAAANVDFEVISFVEFAKIVNKCDDPLSKRFAKSLGTWSGLLQ